jgi:hypothetical protein
LHVFKVKGKSKKEKVREVKHSNVRSIYYSSLLPFTFLLFPLFVFLQPVPE